jgi:hypothetical protein
VRHFLRHGWPLQHANVLLMAAAVGLFLAAYGFKAFGWRRLFARSVLPDRESFACERHRAEAGLARLGRWFLCAAEFPSRGATDRSKVGSG